MTVYRPGSDTALATNDDLSPSNANARITLDPTAANAEYAVMVRLNSTYGLASGEYNLVVR